jgi:hypothetical protein
MLVVLEDLVAVVVVVPFSYQVLAVQEILLRLRLHKATLDLPEYCRLEVVVVGLLLLVMVQMVELDLRFRGLLHSFLEVALVVKTR